MAKYKVSVSRVRYTDVEVEASNEEEAAVKARMFIDKDGSWNYHWVEDSSLDVCEAHLLKTPEQKKLDKMIDKLRSWGLFVEEQKTAEDEVYGYIVTGNVDCADYDAGFELLPDEDGEITAEIFLEMWQKAVREWNPDAALWRWLKTLEDYEAQELIRSGMGYFDDFKCYLRKTVGDMTAYLRKLEGDKEV